MKVVVVGASGNVGTAVLRALRQFPEVTEVMGVSRRRPAADGELGAVPWHVVDIGQDVRREDEQKLIERLGDVVAGADSVIHLAWLIQPNHDRDLLRRTNVDGTRRVLEACARAGVPHVVVASSVGAYTPVDDDRRRDETHPTGGVPTSHYSVDKAAQEEVIARCVAQHPEMRVAWLRPSLIFQGSAGAEVTRYFLGSAFPRALAGHGRVPVLPWPRGMRLQAVHSDDVADAYARAVVQRAEGPFNVAAPDVLRGEDIAEILGARTAVEVPHAPVRTAMAAAWSARVLPADPGWFDMGAGAPLLDTSRARDELRWSPSRTGAEAVREIVDGIREGAGVDDDGPMRPAGREEGTDPSR